MSAPRRLTIAIMTAGLVGSGLVVGVASSAMATQSGRPEAPMAVPTVARGLIVKTTTPTPSDALLDEADAALGEEAEVVDDEKLLGSVSKVQFDAPIDAAVATEVAAQIQERPDVVWAAADTLRRAQANPPVTATDPLFGSQRNLWDRATASPVGGYSIKAPALWKVTKGDQDVTVAVLDTGVLPNHPDLAGQLVSGYDMVDGDRNQTGTAVDYSFFAANDGDGRDADPSDPGDWVAKGDCYPGTKTYPPSPAESSSWHGTFVAGIVAAREDDSFITGVAPGVKVQPVRVFGRCGGYDSDILAGITWASGGTVVGVPENARPSQVINMSLGVLASSVDERNQACRAYNEVVTGARSRGAVLVAAAGNEGSTEARLAVPASCTGVISVAATSFKGFGSQYSNIGKTVDLSAPGGDTLVEGKNDSILSLDYSGTRAAPAGTTVPAGQSYTYAREEGTSSAAPQVAAGAALLASLLDDVIAQDATPLRKVETLEKMVVSTVTPFRARSTAYAAKKVKFGGTYYYIDLNCKLVCGSGILDLGQAKVPLTQPTVVGRVAVGEPLIVGQGTWVGTPKSFENRWLLSGSSTMVSGGATYFPPFTARGKKVTVTSSPTSATGYGDFELTSAESAVIPENSPEVALVGGPGERTAVYGRTTPKFEVVVPGAGAGAPVEIRSDTGTLARGVTDAGGIARIAVPGTAWQSGLNKVRGAFLGDGVLPAASSTRRSVIVAKTAPKVTTSLAATVSRKSRAKYTITVKAAGVSAPTGPLYVDVDSKRYYTTMYASEKGRKVYTLPKLSKGTHQVKATFPGTSVFKLGRSGYEVIRSK